MRPLTAAPDLDGWAVVERLLKDLEPLEDQIWLVIDDVHELRSAEALRQLELLLMRAPPELRFVLATRHDLRLGLHRLRLEGELTEIRAADLRFTLDEARTLEEANAFVVSLDAARSWFRYHQLFADLLQLELRRTAPGEVAALHRGAAAVVRGRTGIPVEAIRHAQAAQDWGLAARLLADHWPGLQLGGQAATVHAMLAGFPAEATAADAELAALAAADELARGSLEEAERLPGAGGAAIGVGAGRAARARRRCCSGSFGCCWPGSAGICRRWPRRRGGCRPWPRRRTRRQAWPGRGAARAGADQPRHHRGLGGPVRGGRAAPGAGRGAGAPDRAAVSGVQRPGAPGGDREFPVVVCAGGGAQQAGDRTGPAARLDRRAGRRHRLHDARDVLALAGAAGGGGALGAARRAHRQGGSRAQTAGCWSATPAGCSSWRAAVTPTRSPPSEAAERLAGLLAAPHLLVDAGAGTAAARPGAAG